MKVGGSVYLDQYLDDRFTAAGAVWLGRADITGDLACNGAQLGSNRDGIGLLAEGMKVGGEVFLREGFTADGAVRLLGADIAGDSSCRAARSCTPAAICLCIARAHSTAATTDANSMNIPSPIVLNSRPLCASIIGWTISRRSRTRAAAPASSSPIIRE